MKKKGNAKSMKEVSKTYEALINGKDLFNKQ